MLLNRPVESWQDIFDRKILWQSLQHRMALDNPFITSLWSEIWFDTHLDKKRRYPLLLSSTTKGEEGVILLSQGQTHRFKLPVKSIESIGAGRSPNDRHYVFVQEPLITPKAIDPLLAAIKTLTGWSFFRLAPLKSDYPFFEEFITAANHHDLTALILPYSVGYEIQTGMGWEAYQKSRSKKFRKSMRSAVNKMHKHGTFKIKAHRSADCAEHLIGILSTITKNSWKVGAETDIFNPAYKGFWEKAFRETLAVGQTTLWVLYDKEHPVGYEWTLKHGRRLFSLKADYDEKYAHFSPGNLLAWHILENSFETGVLVIDYLMGGRDYKKRWATDSYQLVELLVFNRSLYSRLWHYLLSHQSQIKTAANCLKRIKWPGK